MGLPSMDQLLSEQASRNGRLLFRVAFDIVHDGADAEDAVQQAFLKAWEHQDRLRTPAALSAWLTQTVIRECLTLIRRRKTTSKVMDRQARLAPAPAASPFEASEQRERVLSSVAELPESLRTIVVLRLLHDMPGSEIKVILGCSGADVSRKLHQGMEMLRQKLKDWQPTTGEP